MGFWSFFKKNKREESPNEGDARDARDPAANASTRAAPESGAFGQPPRSEGQAPGDPIARLIRVGLAGGPTEEEAVAIFASMRGSRDEARAVEELARTTRIRPLGSDILLALGSALVDRGELAAAEHAMNGATSSPALLLLGDLAERRGDFPAALALVERVLLRDLDHPGARERHRRFRAKLGYEIEHKVAAPGATMVAREPDAPFDLLREVGRGGAGAVYEAVDRDLGRQVALKVYHRPERDKGQLAHEARVAAALEGPGVVRVFDLDPDHGWIALEWAHLGALREHVRARDLARLLPIERWALPLARALARTHTSGWVHHDVKPANVLLDRSGEGLLTDFGIARRRGEPSPAGSLGYVSPERVAGRASDPRDDVFGFGRVLEDVLDAAGDASTSARYKALAAACTGKDDQRPPDGAALVTRLVVELGAR